MINHHKKLLMSIKSTIYSRFSRPEKVQKLLFRPSNNLLLSSGPSQYNIGMGKYPIYLELKDKRAVVVGAGPVALRKARSLLEAGARLVVVADKIAGMLNIQSPDTELIESKYSKEYLTEAVIVIAATNDQQLNKQIYRDCQELEILCNVVDQPELCDFFVPAVVNRGDLKIAIGTEGDCPAYAGHLRKKLEGIFTERHGQFLSELETLRKRIINEVTDTDNRKSLLGELVDDESFTYFTENGPAAWRDRAEEIVKQFKVRGQK